MSATVSLSQPHARLSRYPAVLGVSVAAVLGLTLLHLVAGQVLLAPGDVLAALLGHPREALDAEIVLDLRLPRTLIALLAGGMLGLAGAILQATTRNPLAEPTLTGVSAGGVLLAALWVTLVPGASDSDVVLPVAAVLGSLAAGGLVYGLTWRGASDPLQLVLTGVLVSAVLGSGTALLMVLYNKFLGSILIWVIGSLDGRAWAQWAILWPWALALIPLGLGSAALANALALGDGVAAGLGLRVERTRLGLLALAALLTAGAVAVVGAVAFVGLIGPHIARRLAGDDARRAFPLAAIISAGLLVGADVVTEMLWVLPLPHASAAAPSELPVGAVTALLGALFFLVLLRKGGA